MDDCIFCKIVRGEIPCHKIYEDDNFLAFLDIQPYCDGHTLLIPKTHYRWMWDLPDAELGNLHIAGKKIATHFQKVTGQEDVYTFLFGMMVPHAHLHIFPAVNGSNLDGGLDLLSKSTRLTEYPTSKLEEQMQKLKM